jgi:hypothetical protein
LYIKYISYMGLDMRKLIDMTGSIMAAAALLSACGGGGGSPGTTEEQYDITLRADQTRLPTNIGNYPPGSGVNAPFSTTLYVNATSGGRPIAGGEEVFECNMEAGLDVGSLYYLDGDPEHMSEDDPPVPLAYRNITLGANAGGNSFHFHADNRAGDARITCAITDPRDGRRYSASVNITVGGGAGSGLPASLYAISDSGVLGSQNNTNNIPNNTGITVAVMDDAVQPVPNPAAANVQVRIVSGTGARLLWGAQSGNQIQVRTTGGVAQFSLSSGPAPGTIQLELTADRFDNDVSNGIRDRIVQTIAIPVVNSLP